ncbi:hypothetical protein MYX64_10815 [Nitrospinae bacterium AH_259_B05_G02_I21]|nr:hypothetical protein [Nitrospinae bacterium AH_259_B05_G02_I21]MDA2931887.1 hypothetical protein [Nitrospinae bacterium AH-259-F20]
MTTNHNGEEATATYTCPTCEEAVERNLLVFLRHTDQHIIETLKALHPEWVEADGESPAVLDFYRAQLGHDPW